MEILLGLIFLFCVFGLPGIIRNFKFDNRLPPDGYRVGSWCNVSRFGYG